MTTMKLTPFREELTEIIDNLPESGPVTLVKYNTPVAEVRAVSPEIERKRTKETLKVFRYLESLSEKLPEALIALGIDTMQSLGELTRRHRQFILDGVTFDRYPEHCLPSSGPLTVDETLARLYFGDDYPDELDGPYDWFLACARLQEEASRRGMEAALPHPNAYDESEPSFVGMAAICGHTPETLTQFGVRALDEGVALKRVADMLGSEPVPADVAALPEYNDYDFGRLKEGGMSHAETIEVFRKGISGEALKWVQAGLRTADEIVSAVSDGISVSLAIRAARDGLTPDEWRVAVPKVQHYKYRGAGRAYSSEPEGLLPFRMLVEAAEEGLSLVRWDNYALASAGGVYRGTAGSRKLEYPWVHVYDEGVLEAARNGLSPSYVEAFGELMKRGALLKDDWEGWSFLPLAVRARELGLTTATATAMSRSGNPARFSPSALLKALEEGGLDVTTARYLADTLSTADEWIDFLRAEREGQPVVDSFVEEVKGGGDWAAFAVGVEGLRRAFDGNKYLARNNLYGKAVAASFLSGGRMSGHQLRALMVLVQAYVFDSPHYLDKAWREEYLRNSKGRGPADGLLRELRGRLSAVQEGSASGA